MARKRHRKKKREQPEVELKMAAMLDMAFQLLAFFILTFKPAPIETQISLRMPPDQPITKGSGTSTEPPPDKVLEDFSLLLTMQLHANSNGQLAKVVLPNMSIEKSTEAEVTAALQGQLSGFFSGGLYDSVSILVDPRLHYEPLLQVVESCTRQKLPTGDPVTKVSFAAMQ